MDNSKSALELLEEYESTIDKLLSEVLPQELFYRDDLSSMEFSINPSKEEKASNILKKLKTLIEDCGGKLFLNKDAGGPHTIRLVRGGHLLLNVVDDYFYMTYILDCVEKKKLLNLNNYRVGESKFTSGIEVMDILAGNKSWGDALCLKPRDLLGGLSFESSAVMRLIEERCARVIVVLSPEFLKSNANRSFTQFAHALSIDQKRRILIPCMYKPCQKPHEISYSFTLDYFRPNKYWDYWQKLADSLAYKENQNRLGNTSRSGANILELPATTSSSHASNTGSSMTTSQQNSNGILSRLKKKKEVSINKKNESVAYPTSVVEGSSSNFRIPSSKPDDTFVDLPQVPDTEPEESNTQSYNSTSGSSSKSSTTLSNGSLQTSFKGNLMDKLKALKFKLKRKQKCSS